MLEDYLRKLRGYYYHLSDRQKRLVAYPYTRLPNSLRYGKAYKEFTQILSASSNLSKDEIEAYRYKKLLETITIAFNHIPYYQKKFSEYGVGPYTLRDISDIDKFTFLTKKDVKENYLNLINPTIKSAKHLVTTTGGSTAEPMRFLQVKGLTRTKEKAFITNGWERAGYYLGAKVVQLKGRSVGEPEKNIFWEFEPIQNYLEMDSNYLTENNIPLYLEKIREFDPEFLIGFPSSLYLLAKYLKKENTNFPNIKTVFLASENIYPWQRSLMEEVFDCRVFSHYGHSEMVLLGMECENSNSLHFFSEYGSLELLDSFNEPVLDVGKIGELVGTSFDNPLMPFIRYKTQDFGVYQGESCPACGRVCQVLSDVEGRLQEFIVTKDDRLISICTMGAAHFDTLDYVWETQYYQDKKGELIFNVVPKPGFSDKHENLIKASLLEKLGNSCTLKVKKVDDIKRTKSGKHMMIDQRLRLDFLDGSQNFILQD